MLCARPPTGAKGTRPNGGWPIVNCIGLEATALMLVGNATNPCRARTWRCVIALRAMPVLPWRKGGTAATRRKSLAKGFMAKSCGSADSTREDTQKNRKR